MSMRWIDAMAGVAVVELRGVQAEVGGVEYDSRRVGKADVIIIHRAADC